MTARAFIEELRREILAHPTVNHPFLQRVRSTQQSKAAFREFGLQLYPHCHMFIGYMEQILLHAPDSASKLCIAKILVDEYGEDAGGDDHPLLFRKFLHAAGATEQDIFSAPLASESIAFVRAHLDLCGREPFLVGLGAIGPGHELPIPAMFGALCEGMRRAGFTDDEIKFFSLHADHDVEHANMMDETIAALATTANARALIRRGALASLEARGRFWTMVDRRTSDEASLRPRGKRDLLRATLSRTLTDTGNRFPWAREPLAPLRRRVAYTLNDFVGGVGHA